MNQPYRIDDVIRGLPSPGVETLPKPPYEYNPEEKGVGLAVESMRRHMTDEGWQVFAGLEAAGYALCGHNLKHGTDIPTILEKEQPSVLVLQDKREWDVRPRDFRDPRARFVGVEELRQRKDIFKVTILKDAHQRTGYHQHSAAEIDCHAWITYYNTRIVKHLAPYVREEHIIRQYHTLDAKFVPKLKPGIERCDAVLTGAVSGAYPLRKRLSQKRHAISNLDVIRHPGYHKSGTNTPGFLNLLNDYKVSICTSSMYGYALRKIIESTACGCVVLTDLPQDEELPGIETNLVRIHPGTSPSEINNIIRSLCNTYDLEKQYELSERTKALYDYREMGKYVAHRIEELRKNYNA